MTDSRVCFMAQVGTARTHLSYFINLVAEIMEPIHAELLRLARELEAVKGQVQTECNALRVLFVRTTTAMSSSGPQHDRRPMLGDACHSSPVEAGLTTVTFRFGWRAMRQSCRVMDRVVLREVAKLEKFEDYAIEILERSFWDVQQLSAAVAAALITCTRGEVATLVRRILSVSLGDEFQAWYAVTQWFKPRPVVEQAASMARLILPKRTKNVNELHVAVMQWELTLVEHESKFSEVVANSAKTAAMRAMLPKDILERFLCGPSHYEELRNPVSRCERWSSTHGHRGD